MHLSVFHLKVLYNFNFKSQIKPLLEGYFFTSINKISLLKVFIVGLNMFSVRYIIKGLLQHQ